MRPKEVELQDHLLDQLDYFHRRLQAALDSPDEDDAAWRGFLVFSILDVQGCLKRLAWRDPILTRSLADVRRFLQRRPFLADDLQNALDIGSFRGRISDFISAFRTGDFQEDMAREQGYEILRLRDKVAHSLDGAAAIWGEVTEQAYQHERQLVAQLDDLILANAPAFATCRPLLVRHAQIYNCGVSGDWWWGDVWPPPRNTSPASLTDERQAQTLTLGRDRRRNALVPLIAAAVAVVSFVGAVLWYNSSSEQEPMLTATWLDEVYWRGAFFRRGLAEVTSREVTRQGANAEAYGQMFAGGGLVVAAVDSGSSAWFAGMRRGDRVIYIGNGPVGADTASFVGAPLLEVFEAVREGEPIGVRWIRNDSVMEGTVSP